MSEVTVVARAKFRPGTEEEAERALRANAESSRSEDGCVSYAVLRGDDGAFMTVERWRTRADADQHMTTPHVQQLLATITPLLVAPPEITVYREV
ncbi:MAG TPA: putative quinol monooxygenase [Thermoanaerobaculia bacterium]|nr:putative quinol monooxygenase [Thermoanaerobaculia bacterium]